MGVGVHQSEDAKLLLELENGSHKRILCSSPRDVIWDMGMAPKENAIPLAETNTKSRLAAMRKAHIGNQKAQKLEEVPNSGRALLLID
ncbi:hypothetical protein HID58_092905 [Brassica napus]|uniref:Uncharacterized protein n=1 Tax=Brassica napus TaxID=3708 RepID=A0ABQ7XCT0_BRANA|nr:hypothetical protein HID58_092905 [Brassica napus]